MIGKSQTGLTLLEVVIVVSLFSTLILATSRVFIRSTDVEHRTMNEYDLRADMKYGLGVLLYEAEKDISLCTGSGCDCGVCGDIQEKYYETNLPYPNATTLCFFNKLSQCVQYSLNNGSIEVSRGVINETLTSDKVTISDLHFDVNDNYDRFTIFATAERQDKYDYELKIQTSITAANYQNE